jgi:hypothetical protein
MQLVFQHGNIIVCQHIYPIAEIKIGSRWQESAGSVVTIIEVDYSTDDVYYRASGSDYLHSKDVFAFQCRYCLIVENTLTREHIMTQVLNTPEAIELFRLSSLKGRIYLESKGMKSRGRTTRALIAKEFGLNPRDSHDKFTEAIVTKIAELKAKIFRDEDKDWNEDDHIGDRLV